MRTPVIALVLLAQLSGTPPAPTPVLGQRTLADVAREVDAKRAQTPRAAGARPAPLVFELATPAPAPTYRAHSLDEMNAAIGTPVSTPEPTVDPDWRQRAIDAQRKVDDAKPTPTTIAVERGAAEAISDAASNAKVFGIGVGAVLLWGALGLFFLVWAFSPWIGLRIGREKGYPDWAGALAGLFLGPFVILMGLIAKSSKKCPFCLSNIPIGASVCPHCQREQAK